MLVREGETCKVTDFGMAMEVDGDFYRRKTKVTCVGTFENLRASMKALNFYYVAWHSDLHFFKSCNYNIILNVSEK